MVDGIYESILNDELLNKLDDNHYFIGKSKLKGSDARKLLLSYLSEVTERALETINENNIDENKEIIIKKDINICNEIINLLRDKLPFDEYKELSISENAEVLEYAHSKLNNDYFDSKEVVRPITSLIEPTLFTNNSKEISLLSELKKEIASCDEVLLIVSFIRVSGLKPLYESLKELTSKGKKLKIITTTYMKATEYRAIEMLLNLQNTEIKISYETNNQRLHAKTYIFKRENGFSTFYIGSSNLSRAALEYGDEWNVKLTEKKSANIFKGVLSEFETYWNSYEYQSITNNDSDLEKLRDSLEEKKHDNNIYENLMSFKPFDYQDKILEKIEVERSIYHRYRNLIVAATGVGKTVLAAFDFRNYLRKNPNARFLYVVHRKEILEKSMDTFRQILKNYNFGELYIATNKPHKIDALFTTVNGANSLIERLKPDYYDYIVVDEIHHAKANTYDKMLKYYCPKILLGLTATPERMDGQDITEYFDHNIAAEMRLPEAINKKLLVPFAYYGITDPTDLSNVGWTNLGYNNSDLDRLFVEDETTAIKRADIIRNNLLDHINSLDEVHGLGFCSSIKHAKYMTEKFNEFGISSIYVTGASSEEERDSAIKKLELGEVKFIFTVDLYNEGIDIPCVNVELLLRPTDSLTIFLQQLGRGLRKNDNKSCLTVLDFIGEANKHFNYADKMAAMIGHSEISVLESIEKDFPLLPVGCSINLEKYAEEYILSNIKANMSNRQMLIEKLQTFEEKSGKKITLFDFLKFYKLSIYDVYSKDILFYRLLREAGIKDFPDDNEFEKGVIKRINNLFFINSPKLIKFIKSVLNGNYDKNSDKIKSMFYYTLFNQTPNKLGYNSIDEVFECIRNSRNLSFEINEICDYLFNSIEIVPEENNLSFDSPLEVHCIYSQAQIGAGFGIFNEDSFYTIQAGVKHIDNVDHDFFLITLNKEGNHFGESISYKDYPINEYLFNWETQNNTASDSKIAKRYINSNGRISLFVRINIEENKKTAPYMYLGEAEYVSHHGSKPATFIWRLKNKIPADYLIKMKNFD